MEEPKSRKLPRLFDRIKNGISNYTSQSVEITDGVNFSQFETIKRIYKFRNCDLSGTKINEDLSYDYYYDIISPRVDAEVKNLRFDTKHILLFSKSPVEDFAAIFIANAALKDWMAENGEDEKLKTSVEEFSSNGNVGFKKVRGGYELIDSLNTFIVNQTAKTINDTDIIERHVMSGSQLRSMSVWDFDAVDYSIKNFGGKSFQAAIDTTDIDVSSNSYEVYEFTGEVSEEEFFELFGDDDGNPNKYFLAKVVVAGLQKEGSDDPRILFAEKLKGNMDDWYIYAHRGSYTGRFWRKGLYEILFDHQIRANEIGNDLARGLGWSSKVFFQSKDSKILGNVRTDIENGEIVIAEDLRQVEVRMQGFDQLIADWNRLMQDADRLANSYEIVRGESLPSNTPFRLGALLDQNAGSMFTFLRQKLTLPYQRVFREWVLRSLVKDLKGQEIFALIGNTEVMDQLREVIVEKWYMDNLVKIGPHTRETAEALKADKLSEMKRVDPIIENSKEIWDAVLPRISVTITGENSDIADQVTDLINLVGMEEDPVRRAWILDRIYSVRNIPIPPKREEQPVEQQSSVQNGTEMTPSTSATNINSAPPAPPIGQ